MNDLSLMYTSVPYKVFELIAHSRWISFQANIRILNYQAGSGQIKHLTIERLI